MDKGTCSIAFCDTQSCTRGWCRKHYTAWQRYGDPLKRGDNRHPHGWKRSSVWPSDNDLVRLYVAVGNRKAMAQHLGCSNVTLTRYIKARPVLDDRLAAAKPPPIPREEHYRNYRERHPERVQSQRKAYYDAHREELLEANRQWHKNNRQTVRLRKRKERLAEPERVLQRQRDWIDRNRDKVRARVQLQYVQRKGDALSVEYAQVLLGDPCSYCGGGTQHIDHILSLSQGGSGSWDNLTAACAPCNTSKQAKPLLIFMLDHLADIAAS